MKTNNYLKRRTQWAILILITCISSLLYAGNTSTDPHPSESYGDSILTVPDFHLDPIYIETIEHNHTRDHKSKCEIRLRKI